MKPHNYAVIVLPFLIIFSNVVFVLFSFSFYESEFEKLGVYKSVGHDQVNAETKTILRYFVGSEETLYTSLLSPNERIHMFEVRNLIRKGLFLWLSLVFLFVITLLLHPNIRFVLIAGSLLTLVLVALLIFFLLTFSSSFVKFHELFFQDTSWQLVPGRDVLLSIFPEQFFKDFLLRVVVQSVVTCGVIIGSIFLFQRFKRKSAILSK